MDPTTTTTAGLRFCPSADDPELHQIAQEQLINVRRSSPERLRPSLVQKQYTYHPEDLLAFNVHHSSPAHVYHSAKMQKGCSFPGSNRGPCRISVQVVNDWRLSLAMRSTLCISIFSPRDNHYTKRTFLCEISEHFRTFEYYIRMVYPGLGERPPRAPYRYGFASLPLQITEYTLPILSQPPSFRPYEYMYK